ncbi:MAG: hypothetical protein Ct9H90mP23_0890 [Methanobacteriota archaeon]|nr:MAG: hypothetical protein Ct9H90mP23_0890 [Euryarchaeota archaeon]
MWQWLLDSNQTLALCWFSGRPSIPEGDEHNLLQSLLEAWKERDLPLPSGELGWLVKSEYQRGMGLKSSSALLMAAVNALSTGNSVILSDTSYSI